MRTCRSHLLLLPLALFLVSFQFGVRADDDPNKVAHDGLEYFGLPRGLLPDGVISYTGTVDGGPFSVELSHPCYVKFSELAYYEKKVSGNISPGLLSDLTGIQVQKFFFWFDIIRVDATKGDGTILFDTGIISERHKMAEYKNVRQCTRSAFNLRSAW